MSTDPDPIKVREENEMQLVVTTGRQLSDSHTATRSADMQVGGPNGTKRKKDPRKHHHSRRAESDRKGESNKKLRNADEQEHTRERKKQTINVKRKHGI